MVSVTVATMHPRSPLATVKAYVALTKPRIIELLLVSTVPTMVVARNGWPSLRLLILTLVGGTLAAGGANTFNSGLTIQSRTVQLGNTAGTGAGAVTLGVIGDNGNNTGGTGQITLGPFTINGGTIDQTNAIGTVLSTPTNHYH